MSFENFQAFLSMGGHGPYVWTVYLTALALLVGNFAKFRRERRRTLPRTSVVARGFATGTRNAIGVEPMNLKRRNRLLTVLFILAGSAGAVTLLLLAANENLNLFHPPEQIAAAPRRWACRSVPAAWCWRAASFGHRTLWMSNSC